MSLPCENSDRILALEEELMGNQRTGRASLREEFNAKLSKIQTWMISIGTSIVVLLIANLFTAWQK